MMFIYKRTFRIYNMKFLLVTLVYLSLQTRITHCKSVPPTGLYFMLNGTIHFPGDSVLVSDIGPQPDNRNDSGSTLVCVTTNVNKACCRENDNNALTTSTMGAVGDWYYPDSTQVPRGSDGKQLKSSRIGYTHQVRLARSPDSTPPPGVYTCVVPEPVTGVLHNASITIDMVSQILPTIVPDTNNFTSMTLTPTISSSDTTLILITPTSPSSSRRIILIAAIIVILLAIAGAGVLVIIFLVVLLKKKNINKKSKGKIEPDYYNAKAEVGAESAYASPQDDYYSTVNKDHTSQRRDKDSQHAHAFEDLRNSKERESSQVYDDIDKDVKNKFIQPKAAKDEATDDMMQMYSIVDMDAKKRIMQQEKSNYANTLECMEISEMYAVVEKKAKNKSREDGTVDEYAVVDKSAKKRRPEQKIVMDEYAIVDKSAKKRIEEKM